MFCVRFRLTGGTENTLFHYVSWDSFHGIVVCPSDGDAPSTGGSVHAEVLDTFHKTCLSMRRLFSPYYKQVSSKLDINSRLCMLESILSQFVCDCSYIISVLGYCSLV